MGTQASPVAMAYVFLFQPCMTTAMWFIYDLGSCFSDGRCVAEPLRPSSNVMSQTSHWLIGWFWLTTSLCAAQDDNSQGIPVVLINIRSGHLASAIIQTLSGIQDKNAPPRSEGRQLLEVIKLMLCDVRQECPNFIIAVLQTWRMWNTVDDIVVTTHFGWYSGTSTTQPLQGTSTAVLVFYRNLIATMLLLPIAFACERKTAPPLSFKVALKLFVHALYGMSASMNISCVGLNYASATSASAVQNLLPVLTFFLAVVFRMESLNLRRFHGLVKFSGIVLCSIGVIVLAFYQGPELKSFINHRLFHHASHANTNSSDKWILGVFLQSLAALMWALWAILQGHMLGEYPPKLFNITIQIAFATIQSFFMTLMMERDFSRWKLSVDLGLAAIVYCGITFAILCYIQTWLIEKRGPVFLNMTVPLTLVITIVLAVLIGEAVSLGSVISGVLMVGGLYNVLWGKSIEQIATTMQGGDGEKGAVSELEEQETAAPVPATHDHMKPIPEMVET
ncbi:hypothetical protein ACP4OV_010547 [Aristida adscensionis]